MSQNLNTRAATSLLQTAQWLHVKMSYQLEPVGLTLQQLKILHIISGQDKLKATVNQIKDQMIDPKSNVSRLLNKLMDKQLVTKHRDDEDQRVVFVHITTLGNEQMAAGKRAMDKGMAIMGNLDSEERNTLVSLLEKLRQ